MEWGKWETLLCSYVDVIYETGSLRPGVPQHPLVVLAGCFLGRFWIADRIHLVHRDAPSMVRLGRLGEKDSRRSAM